MIFIFVLSHFSMKFLFANRIVSDGTLRSAASHVMRGSRKLSRGEGGGVGESKFPEGV